MKYSGILFDMDGTLVESKEIWYELLRDATIHFGYEPLKHEIWEPTYGQPQQHNCDLFMPEVPVEKLQEFCNDKYGDHVHRVVTLDGAADVLQKAREVTKDRICIVTNCPRPQTELVVSGNAGAFLLDHFGVRFVCADDEMKDGSRIPGKPATVLLHEAANKIGVTDLSKCLMVGDSKFDMMAGKAAGCYSVGINVDGGDVKISCIKELIDVLSALEWE
eukprot:GDKJ01037311.1.p1 GENE.GDKJ01037311.1~~GDKJ01037311.1.p1  ORF type:complete len:230 (-),score=39.53 GDKJ01037311.1:58-714(-)